MRGPAPWLLAAILVSSACDGGAGGGKTCPGGICTGDGGGGNGGGSGGSGGQAGGAGGSGGQAGSGGTGGAAGSGADASADRSPDGPLADLDMDFFKCNVQPILDRGCSMMGCHGTDTGRPFVVYSRGRWRNDEIVDNTGTCLKTGKLNLQQAGSATVMCEGWLPHTATEWQKNFASARAFMEQGIDPEKSELLTQATKGGLPHVGVHLFTRGDAEYTMIKRWLSGEKYGQTCDPSPN